MTTMKGQNHAIVKEDPHLLTERKEEDVVVLDLIHRVNVSITKCEICLLVPGGEFKFMFNFFRLLSF